MTIHINSSIINAVFDTFKEDDRVGPSMFFLESLCSNHLKEFAKFKNNVNWYVVDEGRKSFYDLSETEKHELVGLLIKALNDQSEWLVECKDVDVIMNSLATLMTDSKEDSRDYFLSVIKANAVKYWGSHIQDLFDCELKEYERDTVINQGESEGEYKFYSEIPFYRFSSPDPF